MTRAFLLFLIGGITFLILLFVNNPDLFNDIWLYLVGLAGGIVKLFHVLEGKIKSFGKDVNESTPKEKLEPTPSPIISNTPTK